MAEVDLLGRLVILEHRKVDDPAELERIVGNQAHLLTELGARLAGEYPGWFRLVGDEEHRIAVLGRREPFETLQALAGHELCDRPLPGSALQNDIAEAGLA